MASTGRGGPLKQAKASASLSEQAHKEIMDYLLLANKSPHPEIRAAAADIAKRTSRHQLKQAAKVSPTLILWVDLSLGIVLVFGCWYAYLHYPDRLASLLTSIFIRVYLVVIGISLLLSGHLSQGNFMRILGWLESYVKGKLNLFKGSGKQEPQPSESTDDDSTSPGK
jgi:hypothetical protein